MRDAVLKGLLDWVAVGGGGRRLEKKLLSAGWTEVRLGHGLWSSALLPPGATSPDGLRSVRFDVTDAVRHVLHYGDADDVLKVLRPTAKSLENARYMAWFDIWRSEAYRLHGTPASKIEGGHRLEDPSPRDLGVKDRVRTCPDDEAMLAVVRTFLTRETLPRYLTVFQKSADVAGGI